MYPNHHHGVGGLRTPAPRFEAARINRRWMRALVAAGLAALAVGSAGCGDEKKTPTGSGGDNAATSTTASTSSSGGALGPEKPATGSPVHVGWINAQGGQAINVPDFTKEADAAVNYINSHLGGLQGHKLVLEKCFDRGDGASVPACINKFVQKGVVAIVEGTLTAESAGVPIAVKAGIPWVGDILEISQLREDGVFAPVSLDLSLLGAQMAFAQENHAKSIVVVSYNIPALTSVVKEVFQPLAGVIGAKLTPVLQPPTLADPTPQVTAGMRKAKPDYAIVAGTQQFCQQVVPIVRSASTARIPIYGNSLCSVPEAIKALGENATGLATQSAYFTSVDTQEAKLYRAVLDKWAPGINPTANYQGYIFPLALARAVNAYKKPEGELTVQHVMSALKEAKDVPVPLVGGTFTCNGRVVPAFPGACATNSYQATSGSDGEFTNVHAINPTSLLAQLPVK
jgi:branched-chain amino acid transport system substrate-binding protein